MYIVKYIADDLIEGYVKNKQAFKQWLKGHNATRRSEGTRTEKEFEFELIEVEELK